MCTWEQSEGEKAFACLSTVWILAGWQKLMAGVRSDELHCPNLSVRACVCVLQANIIYCTHKRLPPSAMKWLSFPKPQQMSKPQDSPSASSSLSFTVFFGICVRFLTLGYAHIIYTHVCLQCVCICIYFYFFYYIYATHIWRHTYGSVMHWGVIRAPTQKHKEVLVWMLCKIRDAICETHTRTHCNYMFFWKAEPLYIVSGRNETCESVNLQLRPYNYITSWQTLHCLPHMASTVKKKFPSNIRP